MKYWFLVSLAVFAFLVSCGKKDKKKGQIGKTLNGQLDCNGKDKQNKTCLDKAKAAETGSNTNGGTTGDVAQDPRAQSGGDAKDELETIPNTKDFNKMSITLSNKTALIAEMKVDSENKKESATKVICTDMKDLSKLEATDVNPDEIQSVMSQMFLFNGSSIVADMKINKGDKTTEAKPYLLTCNSGSTTSSASYEKIAEVETKALKLGQQAFELITVKNSPTGVLASFECGNDDQILKENQKSMGNKVSNRIRIRKGSSVLVFRNLEYKIGDSTLSKLADEAQKKKQYVVLSCNG